MSKRNKCRNIKKSRRNSSLSNSMAWKGHFRKQISTVAFDRERLSISSILSWEKVCWFDWKIMNLILLSRRNFLLNSRSTVWPRTTPLTPPQHQENKRWAQNRPIQSQVLIGCHPFPWRLLPQQSTTKLWFWADSKKISEASWEFDDFPYPSSE